MSTDVIVRPNSGVAVFNPAEYVDPLDNVRLSPNYIKLVQGTTREAGNARPGQFVDTTTGKVYDELRVSVIHYQKTRVLFPAGADFVPGIQPLCRSDNGIYPAANAAVPQCRSCEQCEKSEWPLIPGSNPPKHKRSECKESYKLGLVMRETGIPKMIQAGGTSASPCFSWIKSIKQDIQEDVAAGEPQRYVFSYALTIAARKVGIYYVMDFKSTTKLSDPLELASYYPEFYQYMEGRRPKGLDAAQDADEVIEADVINQL